VPHIEQGSPSFAVLRIACLLMAAVRMKAGQLLVLPHCPCIVGELPHTAIMFGAESKK
jgi:hypothetical protein